VADRTASFKAIADFSQLKREAADAERALKKLELQSDLTGRRIDQAATQASSSASKWDELRKGMSKGLEGRVSVDEDSSVATTKIHIAALHDQASKTVKGKVGVEEDASIAKAKKSVGDLHKDVAKPHRGKVEVDDSSLVRSTNSLSQFLRNLRMPAIFAAATAAIPVAMDFIAAATAAAGAAGLLPAALVAGATAAGTFEVGLSGVTDALKAASEADKSAATSAKASASARQAAAEQVKSAAESLAQAEQQAARTSITSAQQVSDAQQGVARARDQAARDAVASASRVADAEESASRARQDAAQKIEDSARQVADAQQRVADVQEQASRSAERAAERVTQAEENAAKARQDAADKAEAAARRIADAEQRLVDVQQQAARNAERAAERVANAQQKIADVREQATRDAEQAAQRVSDSQKKLVDVQDQVARAAVQSARRVEDANARLSASYEDAAADAERATQKVSDAETNLADAQVAAERAQDDLTQARKDAAQANEDLNLSLRGTALSEREAVIAQQEAQEKLNKARAAGISGRDLEKLQIDAEQATLRLDTIRDRYSELQEKADEYARTGVEGSKQVQDAQRNIAESTDNVAKAQKAVADARDAQAKQAIDAAKRIADSQRDVSDAEADKVRAAQDGAEKITDAQRDIIDAQAEQVRGARDSARAITDADKGLADARTDQAQQALDSARAIADADRAIGDARVAQAKQALDSSRNIADADKAVADARDAQSQQARDSAADIMRAEQGVIQARQAQARASEDAARSIAAADKSVADARADQAQQAKDSLASIQAANESLARSQQAAAWAQQDAADAVTKAQRQLEKAQQDVAAAADKSSAAQQKAAAAMANLSPAGQALVRTLMSLKPAWDAVRLDVQERLLTGIADVVKKLADNYLPILGRALGATADGFNLAVKETAGWLNLPSTTKDVSDAMDKVSTAVSTAARALKPIAQMFIDFTSVGAEFLPGLAQDFVDLANRAADFVREARESGKLKDWIQGGIDALKTLWGIFEDLGHIIYEVFKAAEENGVDFFDRVKEITGAIREFVTSTDGQETLKAFFRGIRETVDALKPGVEAVFRALMEFVREVSPKMPGVAASFSRLAEKLAPIIKDIAVAVFNALAFAVDVMSRLPTPVLVALASVFVAILGITKALGAIKAVTGMLQMFGSAGGHVKDVASGIKGIFDKLSGKKGSLKDALLGADGCSSTRACLDDVKGKTKGVGDEVDKIKKKGGLKGALLTGLKGAGVAAGLGALVVGADEMLPEADPKREQNSSLASPTDYLDQQRRDISDWADFLRGVFTDPFAEVSKQWDDFWGELKAVPEGFDNSPFMQFWRGIPNWWRNEVWGPTSQAFVDFGGRVRADWEGLNSWFSGKWLEFTTGWDSFWGGLGTTITTRWAEYKANALAKWQELRTGLSANWAEFTGNWDAFWGGLGSTISTRWAEYKTSALTKWAELTAGVSSKWVEFRANWDAFWGGLGTTISTRWAEYKTNALTRWDELRAGVSSKWASFRAEWDAFWGGLGSTISSKWAEYKTNALTRWDELRAGVSSKWASFGSEWTNFWGGLGTTIRQKFEEFKATAQTKAGEVLEQIRSKLSQLPQLAPEWFQGLITAARTKFDELVRNAKTMGSSVLATLNDQLGQLGPKASQWFHGLVAGAQQKGSELLNYVRGLPGNIFNTLQSGYQSMVTAGENFMVGISNGISNRWDWLLNKVKELTQRMKDTATQNLETGVNVTAQGQHDNPLSGMGTSADGSYIPAMAFASGGAMLPKLLGLIGAPKGKDGPHRAQIAKPKGMVRVWAEPETGGEAYIPLGKNKRKRSLQILSKVAKHFGLPDISSMQKLMSFVKQTGLFKSFADGGTYTVKKGDSLYGIAKSYTGKGANWASIYNANRSTIRDPNVIRVGQRIQIPLWMLGKASGPPPQQDDGSWDRWASGQQPRPPAPPPPEPNIFGQFSDRLKTPGTTAGQIFSQAQSAKSSYIQELGGTGNTGLNFSEFNAAVKQSVAQMQKLNSDIAIVAERAGPEAAEALRAMGTEGADLARIMATATGPALADMTANLKYLSTAAQATFKEFTASLQLSNKTTAEFNSKLADLAAQGFGDLATKLQSGGATEGNIALANQALGDRNTASVANTAAKQSQQQSHPAEVIKLLTWLSGVTGQPSLREAAKATGFTDYFVAQLVNEAMKQVQGSGKGSKLITDAQALTSGSLYFASGGMYRAQIASAHQGRRVWNEKEAGGEAFIPFRRSLRTRSKAIWWETGRQLGAIQDLTSNMFTDLNAAVTPIVPPTSFGGDGATYMATGGIMGGRSTGPTVNQSRSAEQILNVIINVYNPVGESSSESINKAVTAQAQLGVFSRSGPGVGGSR
jgi:hypothetical protein